MGEIATVPRIRYLTDGRTLVEVLREHEDGRLLVCNVSEKSEARTGYITPSQRSRWREVTPDGPS